MFLQAQNKTLYKGLCVNFSRLTITLEEKAENFVGKILLLKFGSSCFAVV